ncbi:hypothetical protein EDC04DRAFT_430481 [Pisolithus marmoratus]|nr:hypothetical protein EDC04DRAFT_430481 [Pisolithus marmoratus]
MGIENYSELDTGMDKGGCPTRDIAGSGEVTEMVQAQRINALAMFLAEIDDGTFDLQLSPEFDVQVGSKHIGWTTLWKNRSGWRSAPLVIEVLVVIVTEYKRQGRQDTKFDRCEFLSEVEQIKKWREMLIGTNDEHERRTLLEDTVGKILLACWHGVASEIMQVLRKVVDRYIANEVVEDGNDMHGDKAMKDGRMHRSNQLFHIGLVLSQTSDYIPCDYPNPLQRIMDDARDGISKHQLLLGEQAALASLSNEAGHTLKRKQGASVSAEPPTPVRVKH